MDDLTFLDRPEILQIIFYPRRDSSPQPQMANALTRFIPVEEGISISCRFYLHGEGSPNILFFHGNGEIASDYDGIAPVFTQMGINLFVADYRGYGMSGGKPTLTNMMRDAHPIFEGFKQMLEQEGYSGSLFVMGRSLGSASAIELAYSYHDRIRGLIIESGFADFLGLLNRIGVPLDALGLSQVKALSNSERVRSITIPTLIIHAEYDFIIPLQEGKVLYENSAATEKSLLVIPKATHNDIFLVGIGEYSQAVRQFVTA